MTNYLVFSRKFRPQGFDDVVGQEPIVRTLKNGIEQGRIPQNFLFSGPRGVGKTSTARILAKALNCVKGPTMEPCDKCQSCREITQGNSLDVFEIDGASNRGIDEVRDLRETVKFKPVASHFKVYIIDEVHMLTTEAFNAILKTLEEPPPHVKFIFATTESHKLPLTILSRCQRFNFKRIPIAETVTKLEGIAKKEKIKYEKNTLFLIAKASDGALRDAEGLLDQLVSFSDGTIKEADVLSVLGLASEDSYFETLRTLKEKKGKELFELIRKIYDEGVDLVQYAKGMFEMFRHLLLLQCAEKADEFIEVSEEAMAKLHERKNDFTRGELLLALSLLGNLQNQLRRNLMTPRLLIETTLLKLIHLDQLKSIEELAGNNVSERPAPSRSTGSSSYGTSPSLSQVAPFRPSAASPINPPAKEFKAQTMNAPVVATLEVTDLKPETAGTFTLNDIEKIWPRVIEYVKSKRMSNGVFLSESQPVEVQNHRITLGFPPEFQFHKEMLEKDANRKLIEEAFQVCVGSRVMIAFVLMQLEQKEFPATESGPTSSPSESKLPEIISEAMGIFDGAKIVRTD